MAWVEYDNGSIRGYINTAPVSEFRVDTASRTSERPYHIAAWDVAGNSTTLACASTAEEAAAILERLVTTVVPAELLIRDVLTGVRSLTVPVMALMASG